MSEEIDVTDLERLALTEQLSPELLPWTPMVERHIENFKELVRHQEQEVANVGLHYSDPKLAAGVIQLDLDRTKYLLASCLRRRLMKIQAQNKYLMDMQEVMSEAEKVFLSDYVKIKEIHMKQAFLVHVERGIQGLGAMEEDMVTEPEMGKYVCVRVLKPLVPLDIDGQTAQLAVGQIWMLPYSRVRNFIRDGSVELI